jgi:hypothetical protein
MPEVWDIVAGFDVQILFSRPHPWERVSGSIDFQTDIRRPCYQVSAGNHGIQAAPRGGICTPSSLHIRWMKRCCLPIDVL